MYSKNNQKSEKYREYQELRERFKDINPRELWGDLDTLPATPCEKWVKVVWYSENCGGKLVTFKAGSPYGAKLGTRKEGLNLSEEEKEEIRLSQSLSRTRRRIYEIAACNPWQWFFTGTLDGEKVDRNDLNGTFRKMAQFFRDFRKGQKGERITYLLVPEKHKKGGWHFHGLINGLSAAEMRKFTLDDTIPYQIRKTLQSGVEVYSWTAYSERFGYSTATRVRSEAAVSAYVTKYITKDVVADNKDLGRNRHLYYASQKLRRPEVLAESFPATEYAPGYDYQNDYVEIKSLKTREEADAIIKLYGLKRAEGGEQNAD